MVKVSCDLCKNVIQEVADYDDFNIYCVVRRHDVKKHLCTSCFDKIFKRGDVNDSIGDASLDV